MPRVALTYETLVDGEVKVCPFSPITEFGEWYSYDKRKADKCLSMLGALEQWSSESSPAEQDATHEAIIDEICALNVTGFFKKYVESDDDVYDEVSMEHSADIPETKPPDEKESNAASEPDITALDYDVDTTLEEIRFR